MTEKCARVPRRFLPFSGCKLACLSAFMLALTGCWDHSNHDFGPVEVTVLYGHQTFIAGEQLTLEFSAVDEYRCPSSYDCVWEGNAAIVIKAWKSGEPSASLNLNTSSSFPREAEYLDYSIRLIRLEPYPITDDPIPASDYVATLIVEER